MASVSRIVWEARKNDSAIVCKAGPGFARNWPSPTWLRAFNRAGFGWRFTGLENIIVSLRTMKNDLMADTSQKG